MKQLFTVFTLVATLIISSCSKDEKQPYTTPFIHIMDNGAATATVSENANAISTYNVYFSTPQNFETVTVTYQVVAGDGLKEGVDYQLINEGSTVTFLPGIYDMPIRIKWMPNPIDISKNNTLKIELVSNDKGIILGLPGKDGIQKAFTITKVK